MHFLLSQESKVANGSKVWDNFEILSILQSSNSDSTYKNAPAMKDKENNADTCCGP